MLGLAVLALLSAARPTSGGALGGGFRCGDRFPSEVVLQLHKGPLNQAAWFMEVKVPAEGLRSAEGTFAELRAALADQFGGICAGQRERFAAEAQPTLTGGAGGGAGGVNVGGWGWGAMDGPCAEDLASQFEAAVRGHCEALHGAGAAPAEDRAAAFSSSESATAATAAVTASSSSSAASSSSASAWADIEREVRSLALAAAANASHETFTGVGAESTQRCEAGTCAVAEAVST